MERIDEKVKIIVETEPYRQDDGYCHLRWVACPSVLSCCGWALKPYAHSQKSWSHRMRICPECKRPLCPLCIDASLDPASPCRACGMPASAHKKDGS